VNSHPELFDKRCLPFAKKKFLVLFVQKKLGKKVDEINPKGHFHQRFMQSFWEDPKSAKRPW